jgi:hypothetical protein
LLAMRDCADARRAIHMRAAIIRAALDVKLR